MTFKFKMSHVPTATYRLQFSRYFTFRDAAGIIGYLARLGVSDVYASPVFQARPGSAHGYDVTDPTSLNPELGGEFEFDRLAAEIKRAGLGLLLDIVPNHMGACPENQRWRDVQEKGSDSPNARFFDIDWLDFGLPGGARAGYRRFFGLGDFVGVRIEDPEVFRETHALVFRLAGSGVATGVRVDHIDGLFDPLKYLRELQRSLGGDFYILVEKILSGDEPLPSRWPVSGTTGYEFAARLNELLVDGEGLEEIDCFYRRVTGRRAGFRDSVYRKKRLVMRQLFSSEIRDLAAYLAYLGGLAVSGPGAAKALAAVTACLPVYRTYVRSGRVGGRDRRYLEQALAEAERRNISPGEALQFLRRVLLLDYPPGFSRSGRRGWLLFVMKWQQLTGGVMAKGYEDTVLYDYNRLVSLNDVGGDPDSGGLSLEEFHRWHRARARRWPHALSSTSTHDTKRSEDVRARLAVLSEIPGAWKECVDSWMRMNRPKKAVVRGRPAPEPNTEYLLYQTLLGAWPLFESEALVFRGRLKAYMIKAAREAKTRTGWLQPDKAYETALLGFIDAMLADDAFLENFLEFESWLAFRGALKSLSQVLLKAALPGVPDFYQGCELWDFSLVDPDNRRPVDFAARARKLDGLLEEEATDRAGLLESLKADWSDGRIKMYLTYRLLQARRAYPGPFLEGDYRPLYAGGKSRRNVCAFLRRCGGSCLLAAAPRFFAGFDGWPVGEAWGKDSLALPADAPAEWRNEITGETIKTGSVNYIYLRDLFRALPVCLLTSE